MGRSPAVSHPDWPLIPADRAFQPWTRASSPSHLRRPRPPSHWRLLCALGFAAAGDSVCRFSRAYFRHSPNCLFGKVHWVGIGGGGGKSLRMLTDFREAAPACVPHQSPPELGWLVCSSPASPSEKKSPLPPLCSSLQSLLPGAGKGRCAVSM